MQESPHAKKERLKRDRAAFKQAQKELNDYSSIRPQCIEETDEYLRLNHAASEAAKKLPWWQR